MSAAAPAAVAAGSSGGSPARPPGRPRDPRADEAILTAVVDLLVEGGFGGLTIDAVAARAGVGKATIYRRWDGKERLVLEALTSSGAVPSVTATGDLRADLLAYYLPLAESSAQRNATQLMPALAAEAAVNPDIAERLRSFVSERRAPVATILRAAQDRGDLPADLDQELAIDLLAGPIMYRLYFSGAPVDAALVTRLIDTVMVALTS